MNMEVILKNKIKVVATDIDGTLSNKNYHLNLMAINYIRKLENLGIKVILVTGQAFPVASALSQYIGTTAPVVAENGCVIGYKWEPILLGEPIRDRDRVVKIMSDLGFYEALTNKFKFIDLAFKRRGKSLHIPVEQIVSELEKNGFKDLEVTDSGFAVHIAPKGLNKGYGLLKALELIEIGSENVLYVGDGENDLSAFEKVGYRVAVANSPPSLKKVADYVTKGSNGEGFAELAKILISVKEK